MLQLSCSTRAPRGEVYLLLLISSSFLFVQRPQNTGSPIQSTVFFVEAKTNNNNNGLPTVKRNIPLAFSPGDKEAVDSGPSLPPSVLRASFDELESSSDFEDVLFVSPAEQISNEARDSEVIRSEREDGDVGEMDQAEGESGGRLGNQRLEDGLIHEQTTTMMSEAVAEEMNVEMAREEEERVYDGASAEGEAMAAKIDPAQTTHKEQLTSTQTTSMRGDSDGDSASDENNSDEERFFADDFFADFDSDLSVQLDQVDTTEPDDAEEEEANQSLVQVADESAEKIEEAPLESNQHVSTQNDENPSIQSAQPDQPTDEAPVHAHDQRGTTQSAVAQFSPAAVDAEAAAREAQMSSQPLRTLRKLQHMLDETDYMTAMPHQQRTAQAPLPQRAETRHAWSQNSSAQTFRRQDRLQQQQQQQVATEPPMPPRSNPSIEGGSGTTDSTNLDAASSQPNPPPPIPERESPRRLWTSGDRRKYKMQQRVQRRAQEEERRLLEQRRLLAEERRRLMEQEQLHQSVTSSDDEATSDPDDGLGFTLPNLPVYMSDAEGGTTDAVGEDAEAVAPPYQQRQQHAVLPQPPPPPLRQYQQQTQHPHQQLYQRQQQQQQQPPPYGLPPPYMGYPPQGTNPYQYPNPYGSLNPQQQQMLAAQFASAWAAAAASPYGTYPPPAFQPKRFASPDNVPRPPPGTMQAARQSIAPNEMQQGALDQPALPLDALGSPVVVPVMETSTLAEASAKINFDSIQKITIMFICVFTLCYCAVSPRTLPLVQYNEKFNENLRIVSFLLISPIVNTALVFDARYNDVNDAIHTFYTSFTVGYLMAFALEIVLTTIIRLGVFAFWEPEIFKLTPTIPALILPWRLRETNYLPKRITLFAADFITSCIACPIIEEFVKLKILQLCVDLPRNFRTVKRKPTRKNKKRRYAEALPRGPGEPEVTNVNKYVLQMLATSLGMKLCDSSRRILMYTKAHQENKAFYALARGIFPIHELCGTRTALALARRDVLGVEMPLWRMLFRAVFIHGLANFRGKKPLFKWNSSTPWSEMQLSPLNVADDSTVKQLASKGFAKLTWLIILSRELGGCIKNYYMISRQAVKRTTTYAGKHAAYAAELAATDVLKKTKDQKKTNKEK